MEPGFHSWLATLIDERYPSRRAFTRAAEPERDENSAQAYLAEVLKRRRPPPLDRAAAWADALELDAAARRLFLDLAAVEHLPENVRARFRDLAMAAPRPGAGEGERRRRLRAAERLMGYDP